MFDNYGVPDAIWCDNGGENISVNMINLLNQYGIRLIRTQPYNPQQNGKIERLWPSFELMTNDNIESIEIFRYNYNNIIPHSSLNYHTTSEVYFGIIHFAFGYIFEIDEKVNNQIIRRII